MTIFAIELELHQGVTWPTYQFNQITTANNKSINDNIKTVTYTMIPLDIIQLEYNKKVNETIIQDDIIIQDQSVRIKNIYADNILLDCNLLHQISHYTPNYTQSFLDYCNEHNIVPDLGPLHSYEFYHSGTWSFNPPANFWQWYSITRRENTIKYMNQSDIELYIGSSAAEHRLAMHELEELLKKYV